MSGVVKGQARAQAARQVENPDVVPRVPNYDGQPPAVGGKAHALVDGAFANFFQLSACSVQPDEIQSLRLGARFVKKHSILAGGEGGVPRADVILHLVGDMNGFTGKRAS